jgi:sulfur-oxidizing protein SoxZ
MSAGQVRIRVPGSVKAGEVIEVRVLVTHPMEVMRLQDGKPVEQNYNYINKMEASYNGKAVFEAETTQAVSQNPFFSFPLKATEPGKLKVLFHDTEGKTYEGEADIKF